METKSTSPEIKSSLLQKLSNFWYHYKWHTLIGFFAVVMIFICSAQMCAKESYDIYIMYAGSYDVKRTATGAKSEYEMLLESFEGVSDDYDENGEISVSLLPMFLPSNEEIEEIQGNKDYEVTTSVVADNTEIFRQNIVYGSYYLCLLSEDIYRTYKTIDGVTLFEELSPYVGENEVGYLDESAVYLSTTAFGSLPVLCDLPEDTVICLRRISEFSSTVDKKENEAQHENAEKTLRAIFAYQ